MFSPRSTLESEILHTIKTYCNYAELRTSAVQLQSQDYLTAQEVNQSMSLCQIGHAAEGGESKNNPSGDLAKTRSLSD